MLSLCTALGCRLGGSDSLITTSKKTGRGLPSEG